MQEHPAHGAMLKSGIDTNSEEIDRKITALCTNDRRGKNIQRSHHMTRAPEIQPTRR